MRYSTVSIRYTAKSKAPIIFNVQISFIATVKDVRQQEHVAQISWYRDVFFFKKS